MEVATAQWHGGFSMVAQPIASTCLRNYLAQVACKRGWQADTATREELHMLEAWARVESQHLTARGSCDPCARPERVTNRLPRVFAPCIAQVF